MNVFYDYSRTMAIDEHVDAFLLSIYLGMEFVGCGVEKNPLKKKTNKNQKHSSRMILIKILLFLGWKYTMINMNSQWIWIQ